MNKRFFIAFTISLFILHNNCALAQGITASIKGRVLTIEGIPASYVSIKLKSNNKKTFADVNGYFEIHNLRLLKDTLFISGINDHPFFYSVLITGDSVLNIGAIQVEPLTEYLNDVEITGRKTNSYKSDYSFAPLKIQSPLAKTPQSVSTITQELIKDKMAGSSCKLYAQSFL